MDKTLWLYEEVSYNYPEYEVGVVSNQAIYETSEKVAQAVIDNINAYIEKDFVMEDNRPVPTLDKLVARLNHEKMLCLTMYHRYSHNTEFFFDICLTQLPIN